MDIDLVIEALNIQVNELLIVRDDILAMKRLEAVGLDLGLTRDEILLKVAEKAQAALAEIGKLDIPAISKIRAV